MPVSPGMSGRYEAVVGDEHLGTANGFDDLAILTDPWLTLFCEMAGHHAIVPGFKDGQSSVGVGVDLEYLAPVGPGQAVTVDATVIAIDSGRVQLRILGTSGGRPFVRGTHDRMLVDLRRFMARLPTA